MNFSNFEKKYRDKIAIVPHGFDHLSPLKGRRNIGGVKIICNNNFAIRTTNSYNFVTLKFERASTKYRKNHTINDVRVGIIYRIDDI